MDILRVYSRSSPQIKNSPMGRPTSFTTEDLTKQETKDARKVGRALEKVVKSAQTEAAQAVPAKATVPVQAEPVHAAEPVQTAVEPAVTTDSTLARVEPEMTQPKLEVPDMDDPELQLNMAAIMANVPTLDFPKDDPKYDSVHRKYLYA